MLARCYGRGQDRGVNCTMTPDTPKRRAPAFPLYADDFLAGTADMSAEEVGGYIRLLCHQWTKGGLPNDPDRLARMAGLIGSPSLGYVVAKLTLCPDGLLRHPRIEAIRAESDAWRAKQAASGASGAAKRWGARRTDGKPNGDPIGEPMATPLAPPMANGWPNDGSPSPSPSPIPTPDAIDVPNAQPQGGAGEAGKPPSKRLAPPTDAEMEMECARIGLPPTEGERFRAYYESNGWKVGKNPMRAWKAALVGWKTRWEERNGQHGNAGQRSGGGLTAAQRRNQFIAGADAVQQQAERTAEWERRKLEEDPNWNPFITG